VEEEVGGVEGPWASVAGVEERGDRRRGDRPVEDALAPLPYQNSVVRSEGIAASRWALELVWISVTSS